MSVWRASREPHIHVDTALPAVAAVQLTGKALPEPQPKLLATSDVQRVLEVAEHHRVRVGREIRQHVADTSLVGAVLEVLVARVDNLVTGGRDEHTDLGVVATVAAAPFGGHVVWGDAARAVDEFHGGNKSFGWDPYFAGGLGAEANLCRVYFDPFGCKNIKRMLGCSKTVSPTHNTLTVAWYNHSGFLQATNPS